MSDDEGVNIARRSYARLQKKYGSEYDGSRGDYMTVAELIKAGFSDEKIMQIIESESPEIHQRHKHLDDYLRRTLAKFERNIETPQGGHKM